jgi:hypothetical protein
MHHAGEEDQLDTQLILVSRERGKKKLGVVADDFIHLWGGDY